MSRNQCRRPCWEERFLRPWTRYCPACDRRMWVRYTCVRTLVHLSEPVRYQVSVCACRNSDCSRFQKPYRPEEEGALALPKSEYGLDVLAFVGTCRYREHRSVPEIHRLLRERDLPVCERTVTNLIARYEELVALRLTVQTRLQSVLGKQGKVILSFDGMQPDVGHEVLWVFRDLLSGEVLLARSLLSATAEDIGALLQEIQHALPVCITGVVTDGQNSLHKAVAQALPGVPHQLCQYHYFRPAAQPIYEADRHAKKELKKQVRGVRPLQRKIQERTDPQAQAAQGYCQAVRSALTDDGRPPLSAPGLKLPQRLQAICASLERAQEKGGTSPC